MTVNPWWCSERQLVLKLQCTWLPQRILSSTVAVFVVLTQGQLSIHWDSALIVSSCCTRCAQGHSSSDPQLLPAPHLHSTVRQWCAQAFCILADDNLSFHHRESTGILFVATYSLFLLPSTSRPPQRCGGLNL